MDENKPPELIEGVSVCVYCPIVLEDDSTVCENHKEENKDKEKE